MAKLASLLLAAVAVVGLSACGNTTTERALSGGGIGAAAGAAGSAIVGGDPLTGAVIGGAAGAAGGALTDCSDIDLNPQGQCQ